MDHAGAYIVIIISCLIQTSIIGSDFFLYHTAQVQLDLYFSVSQAVVYLLYPLLGWLSDAYFTRYKVIRLAFAVLSATMAGVLVGSVMFNVYKILISRAIALVVLVLGMILTLLSLGVFEANNYQHTCQLFLKRFRD